MKIFKRLFFILLLTIISQVLFGEVKFKDPKDYNRIGEAIGDLDGDTIPEAVIVYNTKKEGEFGTERQVFILKQKAGIYSLWISSKTAVLPSQHGGAMGDPFQKIQIKNGILAIDHWGGSGFKWGYTHSYKLNGTKFFLIRAEIEFYRMGEFSKKYDYDVMIGIVHVVLETETYDEKTEDITITDSKKFDFKAKPLLKLDFEKFVPGDTRVDLPKMPDEEFYF